MAAARARRAREIVDRLSAAGVHIEFADVEGVSTAEPVIGLAAFGRVSAGTDPGELRWLAAPPEEVTGPGSEGLAGDVETLKSEVAAAMRGILATPPDPAAIATLSAMPVYDARIRTTCVATQVEAGILLCEAILVSGERVSAAGATLAVRETLATIAQESWRRGLRRTGKSIFPTFLLICWSAWAVN